MKIKGKQLEDTLRTESLPFDALFSSRMIGDLEGAVRFKCKNNEAFAMSKGQAVYISGISGDIPYIKLADADGVGTMPAVGLTESSANANAEVYVVSFGNLTGLDTEALGNGIVGSAVYVDTTAGDLTITPPTGSSAKLQNIGQVVREHATEGIIKVGGAGRTAATPNLDSGKFFIGNASNQSSESSYTLPLSDGTEDQVLMSDGAGDVSFTTIKSATFLSFGQEPSLTDQTTNFELKTTNGSQNGQGWRVPLGGEITHITLQANCNSISGNVNVLLNLTKNGTAQVTNYSTAVTAVGDIGNVFTLATPLSVNAGDRVGVVLSHSATGMTTSHHAVLVRLLSDTY